MRLRKIGGIWWLAIGRVRVSFCMTRRAPRAVQSWPTPPGFYLADAYLRGVDCPDDEEVYRRFCALGAKATTEVTHMK